MSPTNPTEQFGESNCIKELGTFVGSFACRPVHAAAHSQLAPLQWRLQHLQPLRCNALWYLCSVQVTLLSKLLPKTGKTEDAETGCSYYVLVWCLSAFKVNVPTCFYLTNDVSRGVSGTISPSLTLLVVL